MRMLDVGRLVSDWTFTFRSIFNKICSTSLLPLEFSLHVESRVEYIVQYSPSLLGSLHGRRICESANSMWKILVVLVINQKLNLKYPDVILAVQIAPIKIFRQRKRSPSWQCCPPPAGEHTPSDHKYVKLTDSTRFCLAARSSTSRASVAFMGTRMGQCQQQLPQILFRVPRVGPDRSQLFWGIKEQIWCYHSVLYIIPCCFCTVSTTFLKVFWKRSCAQQLPDPDDNSYHIDRNELPQIAPFHFGQTSSLTVIKSNFNFFFFLSRIKWV